MSYLVKKFRFDDEEVTSDTPAPPVVVAAPVSVKPKRPVFNFKSTDDNGLTEAAARRMRRGLTADEAQFDNLGFLDGDEMGDAIGGDDDDDNDSGGGKRRKKGRKSRAGAGGGGAPATATTSNALKPGQSEEQYLLEHSMPRHLAVYYAKRRAEILGDAQPTTPEYVQRVAQFKEECTAHFHQELLKAADPQKWPKAIILGMKWFQELDEQFYDAPQAYELDPFGDMIAVFHDKMATCFNFKHYSVFSKLMDLVCKSSMKWDEGMRPALLLAGKKSVGKSYIMKAFQKQWHPGVMDTTTHRTSLAMASGGARDLQTVMIDEAPPDWVGGGTGSRAEEVEQSRGNAILKSTFTDKIMRSVRLRQINGEFVTETYIASLIGTYVVATNLSLSSNDNPMLARYMVVFVNGIPSDDPDSIEKRVNALSDPDLEKLRKVLINQQMILNFYIMLVELYIKVGLIRDVNMDAYTMWEQRFTRNMDQCGYLLSDSKRVVMLKETTRTQAVEYAVHMALFSPLTYKTRREGERADGKLVRYFENKDPTFLMNLIEMFLVADFAISVHTFSLCSSLWQNQLSVHGIDAARRMFLKKFADSFSNVVSDTANVRKNRQIGTKKGDAPTLENDASALGESKKSKLTNDEISSRPDVNEIDQGEEDVPVYDADSERHQAKQFGVDTVFVDEDEAADQAMIDKLEKMTQKQLDTLLADAKKHAMPLPTYMRSLEIVNNINRGVYEAVHDLPTKSAVHDSIIRARTEFERMLAAEVQSVSVSEGLEKESFEVQRDVYEATADIELKHKFRASLPTPPPSDDFNGHDVRPRSPAVQRALDEAEQVHAHSKGRSVVDEKLMPPPPPSQAKSAPAKESETIAKAAAEKQAQIDQKTAAATAPPVRSTYKQKNVRTIDANYIEIESDKQDVAAVAKALAQMRLPDNTMPSASNMESVIHDLAATEFVANVYEMDDNMRFVRTKKKHRIPMMRIDANCRLLDPEMVKGTGVRVYIATHVLLNSYSLNAAIAESVRRMGFDYFIPRQVLVNIPVRASLFNDNHPTTLHGIYQVLSVLARDEPFLYINTRSLITTRTLSAFGVNGRIDIYNPSASVGSPSMLINYDPDLIAFQRHYQACGYPDNMPPASQPLFLENRMIALRHDPELPAAFRFDLYPYPRALIDERREEMFAVKTSLSTAKFDELSKSTLLASDAFGATRFMLDVDSLRGLLHAGPTHLRAHLLHTNMPIKWNSPRECLESCLERFGAAKEEMKKRLVEAGADLDTLMETDAQRTERISRLDAVSQYRSVFPQIVIGAPSTFRRALKRQARSESMSLDGFTDLSRLPDGGERSVGAYSDATASTYGDSDDDVDDKSTATSISSMRSSLKSSNREADKIARQALSQKKKARREAEEPANFKFIPKTRSRALVELVLSETKPDTEIMDDDDFFEDEDAVKATAAQKDPVNALVDDTEADAAEVTDERNDTTTSSTSTRIRGGAGSRASDSVSESVAPPAAPTAKGRARKPTSDKIVLQAAPRKTAAPSQLTMIQQKQRRQAEPIVRDDSNEVTGEMLDDDVAVRSDADRSENEKQLAELARNRRSRYVNAVGGSAAGNTSCRSHVS